MTTTNQANTKPLVITAQMFRAGRPRIGVTKSWLSNNHWVIHKKLISDQLSFMTQELAELWVEQHLKRRNHIDIPLVLTEEAVNEAHKQWLAKGTMVPIPEPWDGVWKQDDNARYKCTVFTLPNELVPEGVPLDEIPAYCIHALYYKLFKNQLTHMIYVPEDTDHIASTSLCNSDFTFVLRPFRGVKGDSLTQIK